VPEECMLGPEAPSRYEKERNGYLEGHSYLINGMTQILGKIFRFLV
jgi:hypothetical protein